MEETRTKTKSDQKIIKDKNKHKNQRQKQTQKSKTKIKTKIKDKKVIWSKLFINFLLMDIKAIQADIQNYKIRGGYLYKRSKFLKQWRMRWVVLTTNFMYTFTNQKMEEVTDVIDLKDVKSYKSYLRKDEEMIPPGFKLRSADDQLYFCAKTCNEKWTWLVTLERLMDFKYIGASNYNNMEWVKTKGFESQIQFEKGNKVDVVLPPQQKIKSQEQAKKNVDDEAERILKQLEEQQKALQKKKDELEKKQASFILEQKKAEEQKSKVPPPAQPVQQKKEAPPPPSPAPIKQQVPAGDDSKISRVAQMKSLYENKMTEKDTMPKYDTAKYSEKKVERKEDNIHIFRQKAINCLFQQFRKQAEYSFGLKPVVDFLVNAAGDEKMGYSCFVIIEGKSHANRHVFAQIFIQLLNVFEDYDKCENLMKFIELCIFQIPGLFNSQQTGVIQRKLKDIFLGTNSENCLEFVIKNMFIMHKIQQFQKGEIHPKLDKLVKDVKKEETRNWARKLRDIL